MACLRAYTDGGANSATELYWGRESAVSTNTCGGITTLRNGSTAVVTNSYS